MTGWTWEQVRQEMTLPRLAALQKQWIKQPPVHLLVAGYLSYKAEPEEEATDAAPAPAPAQQEKAQDLGELIQLFGSMQGGIVKHG